ncbi:Rha family transcriptional regulator [Pseudaminobacter soli (ex Li et al. 2025)]|uniref:Transcriptional regulator n=1 Tax=Pseudaminobacter soli (ex Li et al. 2025) TaxID=1295366 RepID=A0A2P7RSG3_9HYPH|nr:Rha family transcriptional regulator [Mesorhizobium soli]PSJ53130.1 transcriptional regulator [Mesorhizobium soli]
MNTLTTITPIVTAKDGQVFANSLDVAEFFGKQHLHVLRDIDTLIGSAPEAASNFGLCPYQAVESGRLYRSFDMTRDGFTLLAMGFTGSSALRFKLAYIAAFNGMEAQLKASVPAVPNFTDPAEAAIAWANEIAQQQVEEMRPLALVGSRAVDHNHSLNRFVRTLPGANTMKVKADLCGHDYLYKSGDTYRVRGGFQHLFTERLNKAFGSVDIFPTAAGRARLIEMYEAGELTMKKGCSPRR